MGPLVVQFDLVFFVLCSLGSIKTQKGNIFIYLGTEQMKQLVVSFGSIV